MADHHEDDLVASKTEGFKVGEKKTIEEYQELGKEANHLMSTTSPFHHNHTAQRTPTTSTSYSSS